MSFALEVENKSVTIANMSKNFHKSYMSVNPLESCRLLTCVPTKSPIKPLTGEHNSSDRNLTVFSFNISPLEDLATKSVAYFEKHTLH